MGLAAASSSTAISPVPGYRDIVDRNQITLLKKPVDLALRNGDLALTKWGDIMLGDEDHSAYFRFVQEWRYNYPTQKVLFDAVFDDGWKAKIEDRRAAIIKQDVDDTLKGLPFDRDKSEWYEVNDRAGSNEVAKGLYAGTVVIFLSRSLMGFRANIAATDAEWSSALPVFSGHSIGQVLRASSNNIRHRDEWQTERPPSALHLKSMRVLADVLDEPIDGNGQHHRFGREVSPETLKVVSDGDFQKLEENVFAFASELLRLRQRRRPTI